MGSFSLPQHVVYDPRGGLTLDLLDPVVAWDDVVPSVGHHVPTRGSEYVLARGKIRSTRHATPDDPPPEMSKMGYFRGWDTVWSGWILV